MAIKPIKVSQLNGYIKRLLQSDPLLGNVSVIGEISNFKLHGTGNIYFSLKDNESKISCFLSVEVLKNIRFELTEGMEITASGYIYLFERGGTYSLNIRDIKVEGIGNLTVAFEKLKNKLATEGLFDDKYKKNLPSFPHNIGIITSETGAAVNDITKIIKNRNNIVNLLIYPVLVQGPNAAAEISAAIDNMNIIHPEFDALIVGRGGGSIEELWAFNEEVVARSIFKSKIPIISAVGHETDFTIADFVADRRAETPTAAAQMAVPNINDLKIYINNIKENIIKILENKIKYYEACIGQYDIIHLKSILKNKIEYYTYRIENVQNTLSVTLNAMLSENLNRIHVIRESLEALNPENIIRKGYVAITDKFGTIVNSVDKINELDLFTGHFIDGEVDFRPILIRRKENEKR